MAISFEYPAVLYALGLLPLLALLQLILPRARRVMVSSLVFWEGVGTEATVSSTQRRRRPDWASVLLLALLAALILAASGPTLAGRDDAGVACTVVIDASPSLLMTDGSSQTRLDKLRQRVDALLAGLGSDTPISVIVLPQEAGRGLLDGRAGDLRAVVERELRASDVPLTSREIRNQVLLAHGRTRAPVVLMTDLSPYDEVSGARPPQVFVVATGGAARNVALTRAAVSYRDGRADAMLSVTAPDPAPDAATVTLSGPGMPEHRVTLALYPGRQTWSFPVPSALPDRIALSIGVEDDFGLDNRMDLMRVEGRRYRVAYVGRPDAALLALLTAAGADVFEAERPSGAWPPNLDVGVFVDCLPPRDFPYPAVVVNPSESFGPLVLTPRVRQNVNGWRFADLSDPLTAHLPATGPAARAVRVFELGPSATAVIETSEGDPLVVRWGQDTAERVAILLDIDRAVSTWADEVSFVLFWDNCLSRLAPAAVSTVRYVPPVAGVAALGEIEGLQTVGPSIDETAEALAAVGRHRRDRVDRGLPLWPWLTLAALGLLLARTRVVR
jgi:hypothetical protein